MLKVGLVGIGFMGHGHLDQYLRLMKEGAPVKLVALCDLLGCSLDELAGRWDYVNRFADERQNAMNDDYSALSEPGKDSAAGAVHGIRLGEDEQKSNETQDQARGEADSAAEADEYRRRAIYAETRAQVLEKALLENGVTVSTEEDDPSTLWRTRSASGKTASELLRSNWPKID